MSLDGDGSGGPRPRPPVRGRLRYSPWMHALTYDDADWSLEQIQRFVGGIRMTEHSSVFLIDSRSGLVIASGSWVTDWVR